MAKAKYKGDEYRLPAYNASRQLYEQFCKSTKKLPVNLKRGKVAQTEGWIIDLLDNIIIASEFDEEHRKEKLDLLHESSDIIRRIMIRVRTLRGINMLSIAGFSAIAKHEDSIVRQLKGWANSIEKTI